VASCWVLTRELSDIDVELDVLGETGIRYEASHKRKRETGSQASVSLYLNAHSSYSYKFSLLERDSAT
jgi:hypothetical protein